MTIASNSQYVARSRSAGRVISNALASLPLNWLDRSVMNASLTSERSTVPDAICGIPVLLFSFLWRLNML